MVRFALRQFDFCGKRHLKSVGISPRPAAPAPCVYLDNNFVFAYSIPTGRQTWRSITARRARRIRFTGRTSNGWATSLYWKIRSATYCGIREAVSRATGWSTACAWPRFKRRPRTWWTRWPKSPADSRGECRRYDTIIRGVFDDFRFFTNNSPL